MSPSAIEWCEESWNPIVGCSRSSPGCEHCYAERMAARLQAIGMRGYAGIVERGRWTGKVDLVESALEIPLRRWKPTTYFVNSMSDLFHPSIAIHKLARVWSVMEARSPDWFVKGQPLGVSNGGHRFIVLTKRSDRMLFEMKSKSFWEAVVACSACDSRALNPLPHIALGVSVEDRKRLSRIDDLARTPAAVRVVSFEPLLEELGPISTRLRSLVRAGGGDPRTVWVIVGGESGPGARMCDVRWISNVVNQAKELDISTFVKQLGSRACGPNDLGFGGRLNLKHYKGGNPAEWPEGLRIREKPAMWSG